SRYGVSSRKPVWGRSGAGPAATTRKRYQGSTMSERSSPKTSQAMARSKVRAPSSTTAATVRTAPSASRDRRDHVESRAAPRQRPARGPLAVDVHVDVPPQLRPGLAQPVAQAGPPLVQPVDGLGHRGRLDVEVAWQGAAEQRRQCGRQVDV